MCGCSAGDKEREDVWVSCAVLGEELSCVTFFGRLAGTRSIQPLAWLDTRRNCSQQWSMCLDQHLSVIPFRMQRRFVCEVL